MVCVCPPFYFVILIEVKKLLVIRYVCFSQSKVERIMIVNEVSNDDIQYNCISKMGISRWRN